MTASTVTQALVDQIFTRHRTPTSLCDVLDENFKILLWMKSVVGGNGTTKNQGATRGGTEAT